MQLINVCNYQKTVNLPLKLRFYLFHFNAPKGFIVVKHIFLLKLIAFGGASFENYV